MVRKISTEQFRNKLREVQQKQQRVTNQYNQANQKRDQKVRQAVERTNQGTRPRKPSATS
jgi:hypothetical protein